MYGRRQISDSMVSMASSQDFSRSPGSSKTLMPSGRALFTKSSPAIAKSFDLRNFRAGKQTLGMERVLAKPQFPLENGKDRERRKFLAESQEAWRQKEEDERGLVAKAKIAAEKILKQQQEKERAERHRRAEERQRAQWEVFRKAKEEREEKIRIREEAEKREREEKERIEREEAEEDRIRRIPEICSACEGSGKCAACNGERVHDAVFLCPSVPPKYDVIGHQTYEFGRKPRGCHECEGYNQGITGRPLHGTGVCIHCAGAGAFCTGFCNKRKKGRKGTGTGAANRPRAVSELPLPGASETEGDKLFCDKCGARHRKEPQSP